MLPSKLVSHLLVFISFAARKPVVADKADMTQFPATVAILRKDKFLCAGAAITNDWVITSAKCIEKIPQGELILSVGSMYWQKGYKATISKKVTNDQDKASDIALLESSRKFKPDKLLNLIVIHKENVANKADVVISGWKHSNPTEQLEFTKLQVEEKSCGAANGKQVCATAGAGICVGNPGSPLVFNGRLVGIMPFMAKCEDNKPQLFSKLHPYVPWIKDKIKPFVDFKKGKPRTLEEHIRTIDFGHLGEGNKTQDLHEPALRKAARNQKGPMVASVQMDNTHICSAVFTNTNAKMAVVPAHCCYDPKSNKEIPDNKLTVVGGTEDWSVRNKFNAKVTGKIFHPKFSRDSILYAIAILKLDKKPDKVGIMQWAYEDGLPKNNAVILGWPHKVDMKTKTRTPEKKLKRSKAKFIGRPQCLRYIWQVEPESNFCGFAELTCKGDLGSPVLAPNGKQIAFLSYNGDCSQLEPQVFTRVEPFQRWVQKQAGKLQ